MIYGTHNSATGGQLLWWLRPLAWVINPTSKCQDKTIQEQLIDGVKVFNLQVAFVGGKWRFSHGLALYNEDVFETLERMWLYSRKDEPIYFQLYLDKCFWCKQDIEEFEFLVEQLKREYCDKNLVMLYAWVEGGEDYIDGTDCYSFPEWEEHYWTMGWAKTTKKWYNYIPLPKRHAKKYNKEYKDNCKSKYLMLDFYEY
jgi:hypothetical protein